MEERSRNPLRLLAPVALALFVLAFVVVLTSADVGGGGGDDATDARQSEERDLGGTAEEEQTGTAENASEEDEGLPDDVYVVKEGDTLGAISETVGISVEQLQELNPDLDPQALVSGQQIKLRE
ncbi:MAG: LysM domain-containing protein [Thermoleophilaceae bacterium]